MRASGVRLSEGMYEIGLPPMVQPPDRMLTVATAVVSEARESRTAESPSEIGLFVRPEMSTERVVSGCDANRSRLTSVIRARSQDHATTGYRLFVVTAISGWLMYSPGPRPALPNDIATRPELRSMTCKYGGRKSATIKLESLRTRTRQGIPRASSEDKARNETSITSRSPWSNSATGVLPPHAHAENATAQMRPIAGGDKRGPVEVLNPRYIHLGNHDDCCSRQRHRTRREHSNKNRSQGRKRLCTP